jgi:glycosyltransferase involved in cell wall biosynthesis
MVYKGVNLIHKYDPENKIGTAGQFVYDALCILDSRKRNFDAVLQLGYTSSSIFSFCFKRRVKIITNMDGLEWKRSKYSRLVQKFLTIAEKLAVRKSHFLISDSLGIQSYLKEKYHVESTFIPYGATEFMPVTSNKLINYSIKKYEYNLIIARLEPENNIEIIINASIKSLVKSKLIIVGNFNSKYGNYLFKKYNSKHVVFLGSIYNQTEISNLRYYSNIYFHGHSVGGTNPSLIEAMACSCLVVAHNNVFNKSVLNESAFYFNDEVELVHVLDSNFLKEDYRSFIETNLSKIRTTYSLKKINEETENFILNCI